MSTHHNFITWFHDRNILHVLKCFIKKKHKHLLGLNIMLLLTSFDAETCFWWHISASSLCISDRANIWISWSNHDNTWIEYKMKTLINQCMERLNIEKYVPQKTFQFVFFFTSFIILQLKITKISDSPKNHRIIARYIKVFSSMEIQNVGGTHQ